METIMVITTKAESMEMTMEMELELDLVENIYIKHTHLCDFEKYVVILICFVLFSQ